MKDICYPSLTSNIFQKGVLMNKFNTVNITQLNQFSTQSNGVKDALEFTGRNPQELPVYFNDTFNIKLKYILILVTKNKKNILSKAMHDKIKDALSSLLTDWNLTLESYYEEQNNAQITFSIDPNLNLHYLITEFKSYSSQMILSQFASALSIYKTNQTLWEDGYFLRSLGDSNVNEQKQYVKPENKFNYTISN